MAVGLMLWICTVFVALWPSIFVSLLGGIFSKHEAIAPTEGTHAAAGHHASNLRVPDLFYHLGGNGPWVPKINGTTGDGIEPPDGCRVTQVHMLSRHAERYPTVAAGDRMWSLYQRLQHATPSLNGSLAFATEWEFLADSSTDMEHLVSTGPYAGTLEAFETGVKLRTRYKDLVDETAANGQTTYWASDSARVIDTAKYFAAGFFGVESPRARLEVISETPGRGADTLTPGRTCLTYRNDLDPHGRTYGYRMMDAFRSTQEPAVVARLAKENPNFPFTEDEVFTMQIMCGFETIIKGGSPWCDVFTAEEWLAFEYARDVIHYYRSGPGNPFGATMGWLWLNATASLLQEGEDEAGSLFLSFVHDGDVIPFLTALDLFPQDPHLPTTHVLHDRTFRTSDVVPMGGRIILERLVCPAPTDCWSNAPFYPNHVYCAPPDDEVFVRVNVNDGIIAIPGCDSGPGQSCPLGDFMQRVRDTGDRVGSFRKVCGLSEDAPERITFLHQE